MSQQLTVELTEHEMRKVRAAVEAKQLNPRHMTAQQLVELLGSVTDADSPSKASELAGGVAADQVRAKRLEAAMSVNGMWRGQSDMPQDGVAYQREVRAEWQ